jgi:serine/threonine protein kinase
MNELDMIQLFIDICSGVQCLHMHHYFHLDLKFENILVEIDRNTGKIKPLLTDFETTQHADNNQIIITDKNSTFGTIGYIDPVLYAQLSRRKSGEIIHLDGFRIDLYALCFMLYSMISRYNYNPTTYSSILYNMLENALGLREDYDNLSQLIITFQSIINHTPFITTYASKTIDDINDLLLNNMVRGFLYENGFDPTIQFNLGGIPPMIRKHIILGIGSDQHTFYKSLSDVMRSINVKQVAQSPPPPPYNNYTRNTPQSPPPPPYNNYTRNTPQSTSTLPSPSLPPPPQYNNNYTGNNRGGTRSPKKRTRIQKTKTRR